MKIWRNTENNDRHASQTRGVITRTHGAINMSMMELYELTILQLDAIGRVCYCATENESDDKGTLPKADIVKVKLTISKQVRLI